MWPCPSAKEFHGAEPHSHLLTKEMDFGGNELWMGHWMEALVLSVDGRRVSSGKVRKELAPQHVLISLTLCVNKINENFLCC